MPFGESRKVWLYGINVTAFAFAVIARILLISDFKENPKSDIREIRGNLIRKRENPKCNPIIL